LVIVFTITIKRDTFIPPPVLPAQAPTNINSTNIVRQVCDQASKFIVAYPVVVIMDPTWNAAWRRASANCIFPMTRLPVIMAVETKIIPK